MARDSFNREIDYLRISVTDRCNLGCIYCVPDTKRPCYQSEDILRADEIVRIVEVARKFGVRKVRLTGGEPLLRNDILQLIALIKDLGVRDLSLTTNGTMLARMAGALKEAGLDRVNVSLDTLEPGKYRDMTGGGDIERVHEGIDAAKRAGLTPIKLNMVPIRWINDDEISTFARLTLKEPWHIRFIEFMPSGRKGLWGKDRYIPSAEVIEKVSEMGPLRQLPFRGKGPSRNYRLEGAAGIIGFVSPVSHNFCYCCNRLRITAVGRIRPCLFSKTEVDLGTPLRRGAGNDELERLFALAVQTKPEGNYLAKPTDVAIENMSSIGG